MITVIVKTQNNEYREIVASGHAGFAKPGEKDIVCAAVSALIINCENSIDTLTDDLFDSAADENGITYIKIKNNHSHDTRVLVDSLVLGLKMIQSQYGKKHLQVRIEEV